MRKFTRAQKRLAASAGVAAVALAVGPLAAMGTASAAGLTPDSLTLSTSTPGATGVTATNAFTTSSAGATTITIASGNSLGTTPSAANSEKLPTPTASSVLPSNYLVTVTPSGGTAGTDLVSSGTNATGFAATINLATAIPAGASVSIAISGVTNATAASQVVFTDTTSTNGTALDSGISNAATVGAGSSTGATVTTINPTATPEAAGTPFTVTGTGFYSGTAPLVYFLPAGTTPPAYTALATTPGAVQAAAFAVQSSTQIEGTLPALTGGNNYPNASSITNGHYPYEVVVYNYNPSGSAANQNVYQTPSAVSAATGITADNAINFIPEQGVRVADTRVGTGLPSGAIPSGTTEGFAVSAIRQSATIPSNIPATGVTAIAANVTAIGPTGAGYVQLYSANTCTATTSSSAPATFTTVNFQSGQDTNNEAIIPLSGSQICVRDAGSSVNLTIDVTGYATADFGGGPNRILDTRSTSQVGTLQGPLTGGTVYPVQTGLAAGSTVALNVDAIGPSAIGNLRVFPQTTTTTPTTPPLTAVDNYIPGTDSGSLYLTQVGVNGLVDLYSDTSGTVNVVLDYEGSFTAGSSVQSVSTPFREEDTRPGGIAQGASATFTAAPGGSGTSFVPGSAVAVIGSLSDISPAGVGFETLIPAGYPTPPATASISDYPNQVRENLVFGAVPTSGQVSIYNGGATTNSTFDASGYVS